MNDIILEVQKRPITSNSLNRLVNEIIKKGKKNILLTIIDSNNRRKYLGVKIN